MRQEQTFDRHQFTVSDLTVNNRDGCTLKLYRLDTPIATLEAGMNIVVAMTEDVAKASSDFAVSNGKKAASELTLSLQTGDHVAIFIPALIPNAALLGFPGAGQCGSSLASFVAHTDTGDISW